jgi:prevent-host-death family protein
VPNVLRLSVDGQQQSDHNGHQVTEIVKTANVSELKSRLSSYLACVQRGEEIIVRDRNRPIARIVPLTTGGGDEIEETALVAAGVIKLPARDKLPASFWKWKGSKVTVKRAVKAVTDERDED